MKKATVDVETPEAAPVASQPAWLEERFEGQLAIDVFQTDEAIVIKAPVAGVRPEELDVSLTGDMVTIRGIRRPDEDVAEDAYFYRECYWGGFSRSVILPIDVVADRISATLRNGVLTILLPKAERPASSIKVREVSDA